MVADPHSLETVWRCRALVFEYTFVQVGFPVGPHARWFTHGDPGRIPHLDTPLRKAMWRDLFLNP